MADTSEAAAAPGAALSADHPIHRLGDSLYLRAARCWRTEQVPVWFQRQAGRSLPEYRALRAQGSILDAIADPATAAEITLQPVRRCGVDAAVLFSDIVVPAAAVGFGIDVVPGVASSQAIEGTSPKPCRPERP
ncbi:uroporphyrinogen decarboxylase family protein [Candidatus Poriferisodalis sp.]|uniref:uroporphyrinogen decarboxylase family protein n=1 Tax=Candidatus Poriferisodalis sp. TaxID=3101277 RepID=UPI003B59B8F6